MVCDGAMGTQLYERGIFLNQIFENINLLRPDLVREIHDSYVQAGADILETNSFGANRIKLTSKGLSDEVVAINQAAVRIGRQAAGDAVYLAGSVGRADKRPPFSPTPNARSWKKLSSSSAKYWSRVAWICSCWRPSVWSAELQIALRAARRAAGQAFPIVTMVAFDSESLSGDGATPERAVICWPTGALTWPASTAWKVRK